MVDYERAIKRPFTDLKTLAVGVVLEFASIVLSPLILPGLLVGMPITGFKLRCGKTAINQNFSLPEWSDWSRLFVNGLSALVIGFIYMLPAIATASMTFGAVLIGLITGARTGSEVIALLSLSSMAVGVVISIILALLAWYMLPVALLGYIGDERFSSAFRFKEVLKKAFTLKYLVPWVVVLAYAFVVNAVLLVVPVIGIAVGSFITAVTAFTVFGEIYPEL